MTTKKEQTRKNTKPDSPKALAKAPSAETQLATAQSGINTALQALADALSTNPSLETVVLIETAIKSWTKRLEDTEKISKATLIEYLKERGQKTTDKGSLRANVAGYIVEARPWRTGMDPKKVEALLRAKELSVDEFMDKEIKYIVNESRLQLGISQGTFTSDELETCRYELSYALQPITKAGGSNE